MAAQVAAPSFEELAARYDDSDDDVQIDSNTKPDSNAAGTAAAVIDSAGPAAAAGTAEAAAEPLQQQSGAEQQKPEAYDEEEYDGEEEYDEDDEYWSDDDVGDALDWAESREGESAVLHCCSCCSPLHVLVGILNPPAAKPAHQLHTTPPLPYRPKGHMAKGHAAQAAFHSGATRGPNAGGGAARAPGPSLQPRGGGGNLQKLESRFCVRDDPLDGLGGMHLSAAVSNEVRAGAAKVAAARVRTGDKSDRATVEQAIDPRTRMVLFKMLNRGVFAEIHGCISTGKEANVYHATGGAGPYPDLAIKIYKTSILVFKDRDRYVTGDFRFRQGYCRSNPRKMVKVGSVGGRWGRGGVGVQVGGGMAAGLAMRRALSERVAEPLIITHKTWSPPTRPFPTNDTRTQVWAEKEMRNLARLRAAGIRAPQPLMLRMHVLVMEYIGEGGVAAPRLKVRLGVITSHWCCIGVALG